jgi:hypothetical protein
MPIFLASFLTMLTVKERNITPTTVDTTTTTNIIIITDKQGD